MSEILIIILVVIFCLVGLLLSALAFSGTWIILAASLFVKWMHTIRPPESSAITWVIPITFFVLCVMTELFESIAGFMGVKKRGGSKLGGVAALIGGIVGALFGSTIFPIIGTIAGMLLGSFVFAFAVEFYKSGQQNKAAHIAKGAILAKILIMMLKTVITLAMSAWLIAIIV